MDPFRTWKCCHYSILTPCVDITLISLFAHRDPLLAPAPAIFKLVNPAAVLTRWKTEMALYAARPGQLPPLWTVEACPSLPLLRPVSIRHVVKFRKLNKERQGILYRKLNFRAQFVAWRRRQAR